jgi:molybdopterin-containing oxidoreductase family membrane subunit
MRHLENMGKVMLATGLIVFYGYIMEVFFGWYSANKYEQWMTFQNRMFGPYWWSYWALILCNGIIPQVLWWRKARTSIPMLFFVACVVTVGMWLERFVIIVTSLSQEFMPGMWAMYYPTIVDFMILFGTIGLFASMFLVFVRILPAISIAEMRELILHHGHSASFAEHGAEGGAGGHLEPRPAGGGGARRRGAAARSGRRG